ncbi:MAG: DNA mismatch repair endonuclease MutL [Melioribacteraceae bacterium]|nr:DNA mismatch repair endonuclease MutL [Melioribacteraceae bacterium]
MNKKIKILPDNIANKIAAGEVVQRPESVVKELMENSIDAGSKTIELYIKRAGKSLVQVSDDGEGMSEEDSKLSIERHATSKIESFEDLGRINTYGFRGEALSSIASVSNFEIRTERATDEIGTLLRFDDNEGLQIEKGSFAKGTTIQVKNLFYNTPARRNFLKTNATELKHVIETFKRNALSHPEITFKFFNDDDLLFDYRKGDFEERLMAVFADNILDAVVPVKEITEYLSLTGYVSKPTFLRKSRGDQYLFINKRFVISKSINHAVFRAYEHILEPGDYPFFVLFLETDPSHVDLNVHPQKLEVKFEDEKGVYSFVNAVVKKGLGSHDLVPNLKFDEEKSRLSYENQKTTSNDFSDRPFRTNNRPKPNRENAFDENELDLLFGSITRNINREGTDSAAQSTPFDNYQESSFAANLDEKETTSTYRETSPFMVLLHNKYILTQIKSGLMIIDAHVAHERILYEKALESLNANLPFSQQLLFSQKIKVDPSDIGLIQEIFEYLQKIGFQILFSGKDSVIIEGVPADIKIGNEAEILSEILTEYRQNELKGDLDVVHNVAASYSCKAAIKAGDKLSDNEMSILVDQLFATSMPYVCPHGRPIVIKIPLTEFDKRFGRT